MTFNPTAPNINNPYAQWQMELLNNFSSMSRTFSQNHVALESAANGGNHTHVDLFEQTSAPQTNTGQFEIYTKDVPSTTTQAFMRYEENGTEFQYTLYQIYPINGFGVQEGFFTFLPGGLICYFGKINLVAAGAKMQSIALTPIICKNILSICTTPISNVAKTWVCSPIFSTNLIVHVDVKYTSGSAVPFYYFIIGNV